MKKKQNSPGYWFSFYSYFYRKIGYIASRVTQSPTFHDKLFEDTLSYQDDLK